MIPDLSYYYPLPFLEHFRGPSLGLHYLHSIHGALLVGMPAGFFICCFVFWVRKTAVELFGARERRFLQPLANRALQQTPRAFVVLLFSILIGEASHIFWDSFTHRYGWFVKTFPILQRPLWWPDSSVYNLLQHVSDVVGLAVLFLLWMRWRKRQGVATKELSDPGRRVRPFFWIMQFAFALLFAAHFLDRQEFLSITLINWEGVLMPITIHFGAALLGALAFSLVVLKLTGIGADLKSR